MRSSTIFRRVVMTAALAFILGAAACDDSDDAQLDADNNSSGADTVSNDDVENRDEDDVVDEDGVVDDDAPDADDVSDEDAVTSPDAEEGPDDIDELEPGFIIGSWRAGMLEGGELIANFDLLQDEGETEVTGYFQMGLLVGDGIDNVGGEIEEGSFDGDTLVLKWNPTSDAEEIFTLEARRANENNFYGDISAELNSALDVAVRLTRYP